MGAAISGIVLAGGGSRRMGRDKRAVALGNRPLLAIAIDLVASVSDEVVVSCRRDNRPDIESNSGRTVEFAFDERDGGPLAGLEAALSAAHHELVVVVPVDMPGMTVSMLTILVEAAESRRAAQGAVFVVESALQPFPGAYRRSIIPIVMAQLDAGALRVHDLLSKLDLVSVPTPLGLDVPRSFLNVNTAEDLERANDESRMTPWERLDVASEGPQGRGHCSLSGERQIGLTVPVINSESATRVSSSEPAATGLRLVDAVVAAPLRVVAIDPACGTVLTPEGIGVGAELVVERRLALGGPLVVRLGRARLAIARSVAAGVIVENTAIDPTC